MGSGSSLGPKDYEKKSKLAHVKGVGSSYRGSHEWLVSRLQAVISVPFTIYVLISLLLMGNANSYLEFVDWLGNPLNMACLIIAIITLCWHGVYGVITVVNDYVHDSGINFFLRLLAKIFFSFIVIVSIVSILLSAF
ncbi:MAG: succinate dehydrogenase, hydrophobic membrane anchor protein [Alphaproteobacteria bacterium]|jgi:succinate dehydrogenase / fumarate reductase membrane anchor subunit|nr:succinate dehydrogenase, hydrophobic membrane anchor protein [Alphaproteobacteria bacterium]